MTEYRMVVEPDALARAAGLRTRHYTYPKKNYDKAIKGVRNHHADLAAGRFENTWMQNASVYIETREVSKWSRLDMSGVGMADVTTI